MFKIVVVFALVFLLYILYKELQKEGGFSAVLCELGFHRFNGWKYVSEITCEQQTACSVCGKISPNPETKIEHSWTLIYLHEKSCDKQEICSHCKERRGEVLTEHTLQESFIGENSNKKRKECLRCAYKGEIEISQPQWSWVFENGEKRNSFLLLQQALQQVSSSNDMFVVSNNIRDKQASVVNAPLPNTNLVVRGLTIGNINFMFFPDGIYAFQNTTNVSTMLYPIVSFDLSRIQVESPTLPKDGTIVGRAWLHSRKDGGPDLRYSYNPSVYVIAYALFTFRTLKEGKYQVAISNNRLAENFHDALNSYLNCYYGKQKQRENTNQYSYQNGNQYSDANNSRREAHDSDRSSKSNQDHSDKENLEVLTMEKARRILGVRESASQEEVRNAYYTLIKKYHPDKVFDLGDELKVIAEDKTKEINAAYALLKESYR